MEKAYRYLLYDPGAVDPSESMPHVDPTPAEDAAEERMWRDILTGTDPALQKFRRVFGRIPSNPRCKMCAAPFGGLGGTVMNLAWHRNSRSRRNPLLCTACNGTIRKYPGGAQIDVSVLFADVRGSTALAETLSPVDFRNRLRTFYRVAWDAITVRDGVVDKSGVVGNDEDRDFSALGDVVNVAARLGSLAEAGELLVSTDTARAAGLAIDAAAGKVLELKGRHEPLEVVSLQC